MNDLFSMAWWVMPVAILAFFFATRLSWTSRTVRRRRRSHYKVAAKAKRPMVTFMVSPR